MNSEAIDIRHSFTMLCDDIRLELGNRFSLIGVFHTIVAHQLPVVLGKFAAINHLEGRGTASAQARILSADRSEIIIETNAAPVDLSSGGFTYNMVFFGNVVLPQAGVYVVQTLVNSEVVGEVPFEVVLHQLG